MLTRWRRKSEQPSPSIDMHTKENKKKKNGARSVRLRQDAAKMVTGRCARIHCGSLVRQPRVSSYDYVCVGVRGLVYGIWGALGVCLVFHVCFGTCTLEIAWCVVAE